MAVALGQSAGSGRVCTKDILFCVCDLYAAVDWLKLIGQSGDPGVGVEYLGFQYAKCALRHTYERETDRQTDRDGDRQRQREGAAV